LCGANAATLAIHDMGYRIPVLQTEGGSYYRLKDETGSVLRVAIRLNGTLTGARQGNFSVNTNVDMTVFTPSRHRRPELFNPTPQDPQSLVVNEDVGYEAILDEPNVYVVDNALISTRPAIEQIKRTSLYTSNGEPLYLVNAMPLFKVLKTP